MKRILVINLGSTSSKLAYCEDAAIVKEQTFRHDTASLRAMQGAEETVAFFGGFVERFLRESGVDAGALDALAVRGMGKNGSYRHGAYRLTKQVLDDVLSGPILHVGLYASTVIGAKLSEEYGIPAFLYDVVFTDEIAPIARITGVPHYRRNVASHTLNSRAVARMAAGEMGKPLEDTRFIVSHLGGGFGTMALVGGTIVETYSAEEGSFTPERAGRIPPGFVVALYGDPGNTPEEIRRILKEKVGMFGWLGTSDCAEVERRIAAGDGEAARVYEAMAYQVSKDICAMGAALRGSVDAILLTGGIAHSALFTGWITERVAHLAQVRKFPGSFETEALAAGVGRVLNGEETVNRYEDVEAYKIFTKII